MDSNAGSDHIKERANKKERLEKNGSFLGGLAIFQFLLCWNEDPSLCVPASRRVCLCESDDPLVRLKVLTGMINILKICGACFDAAEHIARIIAECLEDYNRESAANIAFTVVPFGAQDQADEGPPDLGRRC